MLMSLTTLLEAAPADVITIQAPEINLFLPVIFVGLALFLLALELMVLPGFGVAGIVGIVLLAAGLFLVARDVTAVSMDIDTTDTAAIAVGVITAVLGCTVTSIAIFKLLPLIPGVRSVMHRSPLGRPQPVQEAMEAHLVGQTGVASTDLRPAGKMRINGRIYDVTTPDGYISNGEHVYVEKINEGHVVVRRVTG